MAATRPPDLEKLAGRNLFLENGLAVLWRTMDLLSRVVYACMTLSLSETVGGGMCTRAPLPSCSELAETTAFSSSLYVRALYVCMLSPV